MWSAIAHPRSARGSAFALVRFHAVRSTPALASLAAMAAPILPVPIQPTVRAEDPVCVSFI